MPSSERTYSALSRSLNDDTAQSLLERYVYNESSGRSFGEDTYRAVIRFGQELRKVPEIDSILDLDTYDPLRATIVCAGILQAAEYENRRHIEVPRVAEFFQFLVEEEVVEHNILAGQVPWYRCDANTIENIDLELSSVWEAGHTRVHLITSLIPVLSGLTVSSYRTRDAGVNSCQYDVRSAMLTDDSATYSTVRANDGSVPVLDQIIPEEYLPHLQDVSDTQNIEHPYLLPSLSTNDAPHTSRSVVEHFEDLEDELDAELPSDLRIDEYLAVQYHYCCASLFDDSSYQIEHDDNGKLRRAYRKYIEIDEAEITIEDTGVTQAGVQFDTLSRVFGLDLPFHYAEYSVRNAIRVGVTGNDKISLKRAIKTDIVEDEAITVENTEGLYGCLAFPAILAMPFVASGMGLSAFVSFVVQHSILTIVIFVLGILMSPWRDLVRQCVSSHF